MKTIGIKLADGSFYPVIKEGSSEEVVLTLTTANNNQTKVMVDLYRSKTESMDDAEYVDSLQIENLNEHPNGEPDLSFTVSLDENNKLSAKIVDSETGAQSNSNITLVSRTLEERLGDSKNDVTSAEKAGAAAAAVAGVGLMAAAQSMIDEQKEVPAESSPADFDIPDVQDTPEGDFGTDQETAVDFNLGDDSIDSKNSDSDDDLNLDDMDMSDFDIPEEEPVAETDAPAEEAAPEFDIPAEETTGETSSEFDIPAEETAPEFDATTDDSDLSFDIPEDTDTSEFSIPDEAAPETDVPEETAPEFDIPEDAALPNTHEINSDENTVSEQFVEDDLSAFGGEASIPEENNLENFFDNLEEKEASELPDEISIPKDQDKTEEIDFNMDEPEATDNTETVEESDLPDFSMDEPEATETPESSDTFDESSLPDFNMEEPEVNENTENFEESELPDFNIDEASSENIPEDEAAPSENETLADTNPLADMDFDIPESEETPDFSFGDEEETNPLGDDSFEQTETPDFGNDAPSAGGISFTGLYDKETELGDSFDDESQKKTKTPVIICIICAIICIIAAALILFVVPSKYNLIQNGKIQKNQKTEEPVEPVEIPEEPVVPPVQEEVVPPAKEDEVVIIEKAEEVVPLPPPVAEEKPKNITYKIKWGDTLWDIADTYYKNPWRYKYIARWNGIKDPDYIISGTYIIIPAE